LIWRTQHRRGMVDLDVDYATALLAAVLLGVGFVLQQYTAEQEPECRFLSPRILTDLLRKPRWVGGVVCMIAGMLLAAWAIGHLELTLVEPLLSTNLLFALVLAVPMSKQAFRLPEIVGALILCTGVALLSSTRSAKPIGLSFGSFSHWPAAAIIAAIAARRRIGPGHLLHVIYNRQHHVQRVVGAGNADRGGLIGQDSGQAAAYHVNARHEFVDVLRQDFPSRLCHRIFCCRANGLVDRDGRGIKHD